MVRLLKNVLLTATALGLLVLVERSFGMIAAFAGAALCFIAYIALITLRQMREEAEEE